MNFLSNVKVIIYLKYDFISPNRISVIIAFCYDYYILAYRKNGKSHFLLPLNHLDNLLQSEIPKHAKTFSF